MRLFSLTRIAGILAFAAVSIAAPAAAAEITLFSSNAVKEAYAELIPEFEKESGHHVNIVWGGSLDLKGRVSRGEMADVIVTPAADIDDMIKMGTVAEGSHVDIARSIVGVAVRAGLPKPDLSSGEKLKAALLASKSIIISGGPSGYYLLGLFEKQGILGILRPKMKQLPSGASVGEALARSEGDIGFTQVSEFLAIKGINYVGPLPADVQQVTVFSSGILKNAKQPDAAKELVTFLVSAESISVLKKTGLEPSA
jgi:molybdate transport system substrate-binding protein